MNVDDDRLYGWSDDVDATGAQLNLHATFIPSTSASYFSLPATGEYVPDSSYRVDRAGVLRKDGRVVAHIDGGLEAGREATMWADELEERAFKAWCDALRWVRALPANTVRTQVGLQLLIDEARQAHWCEEESRTGLVFSLDVDIRGGTWRVDPVLRADREADRELLYDLAGHVSWFWRDGDRHATYPGVEDALPRRCDSELIAAP